MTLVVVWRVTEACARACRFCGYSRELRRPRGAADPDEVRRFGLLLAEYSRRAERPVLVSWLGGEPLRWSPLLPIAREFKAAGLHLGVTTNGTALSEPTVRAALRRDFAHVVVSVDGLEATHDRLRGRVGLFSQVREDLAALRALGGPLQLRANTVLMRDNIADFEALCLTLAGWGVRELTFNLLGGRDRPEFYPAHSLLPGQLARFRADLPLLRARLLPFGLSVRGSLRYLDRLEQAVLGLRAPVSDCGPGQEFLFIDERSLISPCSFTGDDYGLPLSAIRSSDDLARLPQELADHRRARPTLICADCPSTQHFGKFAPA